MKKRLSVVLVGLAAVAVVELVLFRSPRFEDLRLAPGGSDDDARALVTRVLQTNKPWLEPTPMSATYSLRRVCDDFSLGRGRKHEQETLGPFQAAPGCRRTVRVGSIVGTPLHFMARAPSDFKVRMLGQTKWRGKKVVAVAVTSDQRMGCAVGMGGQSNTTYSSSQYALDEARIWIAAGQGVPLFIRTSLSGETKCESSWDFTAGFYELPDGLAPRAFKWDDLGDSDRMHERQEFQILDGFWLFKKGKCTFHSSFTMPGTSFVARCWDYLKNLGFTSQQLEMVGFRLTGGPTNSAPNQPVPATGTNRLVAEPSTDDAEGL